MLSKPMRPSVGRSARIREERASSLAANGCFTSAADQMAATFLTHFFRELGAPVVMQYFALRSRNGTGPVRDRLERASSTVWPCAFDHRPNDRLRGAALRRGTVSRTAWLVSAPAHATQLTPTRYTFR